MTRKDGAVRKCRSDGAATREAILAAAADEFADKGYARASVRAICAKAAVNASLANRYFGSKEALYRLTAKRLFGDLGAPLAALARGVRDADGWQAALRTWIDDFLFMTLPTERAQRRCAALFRHEVTHPTAFHAEFRRLFGKPVYDALRALVAMATSNADEQTLWTSSIWAQVSVYALADRTWHAAFRPKGATDAAWRARVCEHICQTVFASLRYRPSEGA